MTQNLIHKWLKKNDGHLNFSTLFISIIDKALNNMLSNAWEIIFFSALAITLMSVFPTFLSIFNTAILIFIFCIKCLYFKNNHQRNNQHSALDICNWPKTEACIVSSRLNSNEETDRITYEASVRYTYTINNQTFTGTNIHLHYLAFSTFGGNEHQEITDFLRPGKKVYAFFNPQNPSMAYLAGGVNKFSYYRFAQKRFFFSAITENLFFQLLINHFTFFALFILICFMVFNISLIIAFLYHYRRPLTHIFQTIHNELEGSTLTT